ncbi:MAG: hypothetical protein ACFB50_03800 [Rubrobacteraceae bacterium]
MPEELATFIRDSGAEIVSRREIAYGTQYFFARGPDSANLTVYNTDKVVVGGKPTSELRQTIEAHVANRKLPRSLNGEQARPALDPTSRIGIDEAGKGDYFGPLVVAGVRIFDAAAARGLQAIGVRDSKSLSPAQAPRFAENVRGAVGDGNVHIVSLGPREFERRRKAAGNVNRLLEEINAEIIRVLEDGVEVVVVDEFAASAREYLARFVPDGVKLEVRRKADRDDAAVAAASILARARYLGDLEQLSEEVGFELPRGATHVLDSARRVVREQGTRKLEDVAKISFSTTARVLEAKNGR